MDEVEVFGYTWRYWDCGSDHYLDGNSISVKVLVTREGFRLREEEGRKHGSKDYQLGQCWKVSPDAVDEDGVYHPERRNIRSSPRNTESLPF